MTEIPTPSNNLEAQGDDLKPEVIHVDAEPVELGTPTPDTLPVPTEGSIEPKEGSAVPQIRQRKTWGHPLKITEAQQEAICKALRDGHYLETACRLHGVQVPTLYAWLKRAQDPLAPNLKRYVKFREAVLAAISEGEENALKRVRESESLDWRAAAWRLERRFPRKWGRVPEDEAVIQPAPQPSGPGGPQSETQNVTQMLAALSPEAILDLAGKLFTRPEMVQVPDEGLAQDVQGPTAPPTLEEKARTA